MYVLYTYHLILNRCALGGAGCGCIPPARRGRGGGEPPPPPPPGTTDELIYDAPVGVGVQGLEAALDAAAVHGELRRADSPQTAGALARGRLSAWRRGTGRSRAIRHALVPSPTNACASTVR